jgi:hypothetical protein
VAYDPGILQQAVDASPIEASHLVVVETRKRLPKVIALTQDREPAEARLKPLEAYFFEKPVVVVNGPPPFQVVVFPVVRRIPAPPASRGTVLTANETFR